MLQFCPMEWGPESFWFVDGVGLCSSWLLFAEVCWEFSTVFWLLGYIQSVLFAVINLLAVRLGGWYVRKLMNLLRAAERGLVGWRCIPKLCKCLFWFGKSGGLSTVGSLWDRFGGPNYFFRNSELVLGSWLLSKALLVRPRLRCLILIS